MRSVAKETTKEVWEIEAGIKAEEKGEGEGHLAWGVYR